MARVNGHFELASDEEEDTSLLPPLSTTSALRSHLAISDEDPSVGDKFSTSSMRFSGKGQNGAVPASVHGAPSTVQESREALARLKRMQGFESQEFDAVENDVEREMQIHRSLHDYHLAEFWKWTLATFIGIIMGLLAFLTDLGIETMNDVKYTVTESKIERGGRNFLGPFLSFWGISLGYAFVAGALVSYVEPLAAGSGIPEVKTYLNGVHIKGLLTIRTLISKLVGVMFTISAGLVAGKEGPFVHGGGIVGGGIGGMGSRTLTSLLKSWSMGKWSVKFPRKWGGFFRNDADHRDFTAIGTAAGVATAFASPIGGLLFTIEEGASFYSTSIFWRGFLSTCVGVMSLHVLVEAKAKGNILSSRFGRYRDFGLYTDNNAQYGARMFYYVWDIPIFCLIGACGGFLGAMFIHMNVKITQFRHKYIPSRSPLKRLMEVLGLASVTTFVWFMVSYLSPCAPLPSKEQLMQLTMSDSDEELYGGGGISKTGSYRFFPQLWCPAGQYSTYGQLFMAPMTEALRIIMHLGEPLEESASWQFNIGPLILFFLLTYMFMMYTNGVGASTGMFVPSLAVGATGGRIVGRFVKLIVTAIWPNAQISLTSYSIIGAAAFLGGSTRMTLTTTVMVMETTGALQLIVPIMLTVFFAKFVGDQWGLGIDDTHIKLRGAPYLDEPALEPHQKMLSDKLTISELMSVAVVALPPVVKVKHLVETLRTFSHSGFPVTPEIKKAFESVEPFELHGYIMRTCILRLLRHRIGLFKLDPGMDIPSERQYMPSSQPDRLKLLELLEQIPLKVWLQEDNGWWQLVRWLMALLLCLHGRGSVAGLHRVPMMTKSSVDCTDVLFVTKPQGEAEQVRVKGDQDIIFNGLSEEELDMWLDLRPFMQRHPFVVQADASLSRAYRLFRTMGLRHMFVGPPQPKVVGIVTRKDIIADNAKLALGRKANLGLAAIPSGMRRHRELPFIPYAAYDATVGSSLRYAYAGDDDDDEELFRWADDEESMALNEGERRGAGTRRRRNGDQELANIPERDPPKTPPKRDPV